MYKSLVATRIVKRGRKMGRINAIISDELDGKIRPNAAEKYRGKKGAFGRALADAIELGLKQEEQKQETK
jgi:hypothetical protein